MAIKAVVSALDGLSDAVKALYKPAKVTGPDGKEVDGFILDVEGVEQHPDTAALKRAKDREKQRAQEAEDKLKAANAAAEEMKEKELDRMRGFVPKDSLESIEKSYKEKLAAKDTENAGLRTGLHTHLVRNIAQGIAADIAVDPESIPALVTHIIPRLSAEVKDGEATTRVLGTDGKPTAGTLDDLKKELLETKYLARLVSGTKASGGSSPGNGKGKAGSAPKQIDFNQSPEKIAEQLKAADAASGEGQE